MSLTVNRALLTRSDDDSALVSAWSAFSKAYKNDENLDKILQL